MDDTYIADVILSVLCGCWVIESISVVLPAYSKVKISVLAAYFFVKLSDTGCNIVFITF